MKADPDKVVSTTSQPAVSVAEGPEVDPTLPELLRGLLARGVELEKIRLDRNGCWWHEGRPVVNDRVARLFSRSVRRTAGGTWLLEIGRYAYPIEVADTSVFIQRWSVDAAGALEVTTRQGQAYQVDPSAICYGVDGLYVELQGVGLARFLRDAYISFVEEHVRERGQGFAVVIGERDEALRSRSQL